MFVRYVIDIFLYANMETCKGEINHDENGTYKDTELFENDKINKWHGVTIMSILCETYII